MKSIPDFCSELRAEALERAPIDGEVSVYDREYARALGSAAIILLGGLYDGKQFGFVLGSLHHAAQNAESEAAQAATLSVVQRALRDIYLSPVDKVQLRLHWGVEVPA